MSAYELTFLLNEEAEIKNLKDLLTSLSIKVTEEKNWGKRTLSYPIKKQDSANYYTWSIDADTIHIKELKNKLNFNEKLMRYLLLKV